MEQGRKDWARKTFNSFEADSTKLLFVNNSLLQLFRHVKFKPGKIHSSSEVKGTTDYKFHHGYFGMKHTHKNILIKIFSSYY